MTRPPRRKQTLHVVIEESEKMSMMKRYIEERDEVIAQRDEEINRLRMQYGGTVAHLGRLHDQIRELGVKPVK